MSDPTGPDGPDSPEGPDAPDVGSLGEEAAKLLGALGDWARDQGDETASGLGAGLGALAGSASAAAREVNAHLATDAAECRYCPVCRTVHLVRQTSPEVRTHLAAAASSFLQAAAALMASLPADGAGARPRGGDLERIDLDGPDDSSEDTDPEEHGR